VSGLLARARSVPEWQLALGAALLVLGFLIVAQLRTEPARVQYTSQERPPLVQTVLDLQKRQDSLKQQILDLRDQIGQLEASSQGNNALVVALNRQLQDARTAAGLVSLQGQGVVVQLEDSSLPVPPGSAAADYLVSAADLRAVANELWLAGAEAIAIDGERITATSGLTDIGTSILLNSAYLQPPYQIVAIGPSDLFQRLTEALNRSRFLRSRIDDFGIRVGIGPIDTAVVPAYAGGVSLLYAVPVPPPSAAPPASPSGRP